MSDPKPDDKIELTQAQAKAAEKKADDAAKEAAEAPKESAETASDSAKDEGMRLESFDDATAEASGEKDQSPDEEIASLKGELEEVRAQLMRAAADIQNARRRAERDRREAETYGGVKLARDVLVVYDNLDKALGMVTPETREKNSSFIEGLELVQRELINAFSKHNIKPVDPKDGEKFDPNMHQAMFESPVGQPGTVTNVMQQGFIIGERLLRPALVGVASATAKPAESDEKSKEKDKKSETGAA